MIREIISKYLLPVLIASSLALLGVVKYQHYRLGLAQDKINTLQVKIEDILFANRLTEKLRKDNAELTVQETVAKEELDDAINYSQRIPDDILGPVLRVYRAPK